MEFQKALNNFISDYRQNHIQKKTKKGIERYYKSPFVKFSRLYGYRLKQNGEIDVVPIEVEIIRKTFLLFLTGHTPIEVKQVLDKEDLRTRFGNLWTVKQLTGLIRPIYAGLIEKPNGGFVRSQNYKPIVSPEIYQKALKMMKKLTENEYFNTLLFRLG